MTNPSIAEIVVSYTTVDNARLAFKWISTGSIVCLTSECEKFQERWCEHLALWCSVRDDLNFLIRTPDAEEALVEIPIVPTFDLWEKVRLSKSDFDENVYSVHWQQFPGSEKFVTNVRNNEGRLSIREMLFEMMFADPLRSTECQMAHHGYAAQMMYEKRIGGVHQRSEEWSIWRTSGCIHCNQMDPSGDPDLVPAKQGSVWN